MGTNDEDVEWRKDGEKKEKEGIEPKIPIENFIANFIIYYYCYPYSSVYTFLDADVVGIFTSSSVNREVYNIIL